MLSRMYESEKLDWAMDASPRESNVRRFKEALSDRSKLSTPGWRTEISVEPTVVGSFCVALQLGLEKTIQPACQLLPAVAHVGVPPVRALEVLLDMQMVTQLFLLIASILARETSLENSAVMAPAWFRTMNSLKLGSPMAKIMAKTATVTMISMMVKPASQARGAALVGRRKVVEHTVIRMS